MKNWTKIQSNVANILNSTDTYRFTCLSLSATKDNYTSTDYTFKQIGEITNKKAPESEDTIKGFVQRLKKSGIINIQETRINKLRRNIYYFPDINERFIIVKKEIMDLDLEVELKGFLIQLFTVVINGTYECNLSAEDIISRIKISKNSYYKYMKELKKAELIIKTDKGFRIESKYFDAGKSAREKEIILVKEMVIGTIHEKIDWSKFKYPLKALYHITGEKNFSESEKEEALTEIIL